MFEDVDWHYAWQHMLAKHNVTTRQANEALRDPERVVITPDYNSQSGESSRVIGYSHDAGALLAVIVLEEDGVEYGVNGWLANEKDHRIYRKEAGK